MIKEILILLLFVWVFRVDAATLLWDANPASDNVTGYRIYHGLSSRAYDGVIDVGNVTIYSLTMHFVPTKPVYFAVTAYNADGLESDFSDEVTYTRGIKLLIKLGLITAEVAPGKNYLLEGTNDFTSWLGVEAKTSDSEELLFNIAMSDNPMKFFRLKELETQVQLAMASASKSMERGLLVSVTENKLKTKEKLSRKIKRKFRYHPGMRPNYLKGAERLLLNTKKVVSSAGDTKPPMPPPMPRLK